MPTIKTTIRNYDLRSFITRDVLIDDERVTRNVVLQIKERKLNFKTSVWSTKTIGETIMGIRCYEERTD